MSLDAAGVLDSRALSRQVAARNLAKVDTVFSISP